MKWRRAVHPPESDQDTLPLQEALGLHPLVAGILLRRGCRTVEDAQRFLTPRLENLHDPFGMKGMEAAVERLARAVMGGEKIVVSGDYDVDGMTSTALMTGFLRATGADVDFFVPSRFEHGYGLTTNSLEALCQMHPKVVMTVDNGITAVNEVAALQARGVDTIITDHHPPRVEGVPPGVVVDPLQPGCDYPFKRISGVGVAFKLSTALRRRLREQGWWNDARPEPNLKDWLDLVAIGTVADVVPLRDENRILVAHGLAVLNRPDKRPGIAALLNQAGWRPGPVDTRTIGFCLAPRLNAAGRMAQGELGVSLLLADDPREAADLAGRLEGENNLRRQKGEEMFHLALSQLPPGQAQEAPALVVVSDQFHEGIVGITASRLAERFGKPVFVLAENGKCFKGSARCAPGQNLNALLKDVAELLSDWGGHAQAAGFTLPKENLQAFRSGVMEAVVRQRQNGGDLPVMYLDGTLHPRENTPAMLEKLAQQLVSLEPFGEDNGQPSFLVEQDDVGEPPRPLKERHLKWTLPGGLEMIAWKAAGNLSVTSATRYRVSLGFNEFRGNKKIQLKVEDHWVEE
ncbi:MAG: single-stranded-DNA-specific exonuclease RecJ [Deltaproteobacteria bacterium]|nr:single-stranded-DNA-specific exonuclease RecJ [Deltaproteobacteria bacterium]